MSLKSLDEKHPLWARNSPTRQQKNDTAAFRNERKSLGSRIWWVMGKNSNQELQHRILLYLYAKAIGIYKNVSSAMWLSASLVPEWDLWGAALPWGHSSGHMDEWRCLSSAAASLISLPCGMPWAPSLGNTHTAPGGCGSNRDGGVSAKKTGEQGEKWVRKEKKGDGN